MTTKNNSMKEPTGKKKVNVFDVARVAGISKSTVSLVLNNSDKVSAKTREKVLKAIGELGYVYNRDAAALRSKSSNLVALIINDLTNPYAAQLAVGLEQHISKLGLVSMLVNTGEDIDRQHQVVKTLKEYNVGAFIICPAPGTTATWIDNNIRQGFPVINIMREIPFSSAPTVLPDNRKGTLLATEHLLQQGISKIAFLGGVESISDYHERLSGYLDAMSNADKQVPEYYQVQAATNRQGGRDALQKLFEQAPDIEAIVCFSDVIAYGAIEKLRQLGRVPGKDVKVIGFDDLADSRSMSPALSSVHISADEIGKTTCKLLSEVLSGEAPTGRTLVDVNLELRESSQS